MLPSLPSLAPRDSYNLWYSPTHHTSIPSYHDSPNNTQNHTQDHFLHSTAHSNNNQNHGPQSSRRPHQHVLHRTPLSRLVADEIYQARRKANIQNYGNSWLRPPGVPKSLYQLREEKREMEEHQESMRREQLAAELAEAEAAAAVDEMMIPDEEEVRDLDDDIPDGIPVVSSDGEEEESLDDEDEDDDDDEEEDEEGESELEMDRTVEDERMRIVAQRMVDGFGMDGLGGSGSESGEENEEQMLQEEDLVHESQPRRGDGDTDMGGMDMDADLDEEVPDAQIGGYEHTDTEEEDTSSDDEDESVDMGRLPLQTNFVSSMVRSDGTQNSLDLRSGNSLQESSPRQRAPRNRRG